MFFNILFQDYQFVIGYTIQWAEQGFLPILQENSIIIGVVEKRAWALALLIRFKNLSYLAWILCVRESPTVVSKAIFIASK